MVSAAANTGLQFSYRPKKKKKKNVARLGRRLAAHVNPGVEGPYIYIYSEKQRAK